MHLRQTLATECAAESVGTFLLVFFGCGSVMVSLLTGALGAIGVAAVWGAAVSLAIYLTRSISGAHLNPAITISMALYRKETFHAKKVLPYICSQVVGAFFGSLALYAIFYGSILKFEASRSLVRGGNGSQLSAMIFGEYFPNPALYGTTDASFAVISNLGACAAELFGTALLAFVVFSLTEKKNSISERLDVIPLLIGLTVSVIIIIIAPLTQAGLNPARDFGPRLVSYLAGWNTVAIPGPRGGFLLVYVVSPIIGGILGGGLCTLLHRFTQDRPDSIFEPVADLENAE